MIVSSEEVKKLKAELEKFIESEYEMNSKCLSLEKLRDSLVNERNVLLGELANQKENIPTQSQNHQSQVKSLHEESTKLENLHKEINELKKKLVNAGKALKTMDEKLSIIKKKGKSSESDAELNELRELVPSLEKSLLS